jgi:transcriptional regulator with XRE-family HTH domain
MMLSPDEGRSPRQVFGAMLRFYREQAGLSRAELAGRIFKSVALVQAIEQGHRAATLLVRDSKHPHGAVLAVAPQEWQAFIASVKAGEFDLP